MRASLAAAILACLAAGCASTGPAAGLACPAGQTRATTAELVFGRDIGEALGVSEDDWKAFLDQEVTPRFPDGLSVTDVQGQWRAPGGPIVHEPSKSLFLVLRGGLDEAARIAAIRDAYKRRFHQQSVMLVTRPACVSF